jgi:hypothetical protein
VEETVAFAIVRPRAVEAQHVAVVVNVTGVEELVVFVAWFTSSSHVWPNVVQVAEALGELDMRCVVQARVSENAESILHIRLAADERNDKRMHPTFAIAAKISWKVSSDTFVRLTFSISAPNVGCNGLISSF